MKVAAISVGLKGHGHNLAFAPNAIVTVAAAAHRALGDKITLKVFDEVLLGHDQLKRKLEAFGPDTLLVSVPVTGYYPSALDIYGWAKDRSVPVLTGGYHFNIPSAGTDGTQAFPGIIPRLAANRGVTVCYADGEASAVGFIEHLLEPTRRPLNTVPNLCYRDGHELVITSHVPGAALGTQPYPHLPIESFDPRAYWQTLPQGDVHASGKDMFDGVPIGRTVVGAKVVTGCTYRRTRIGHGKEACAYCTLTSLYEASSGANFWRITKEMLQYLDGIPWDGDRGIRCYQIGDDMGSDVPLVRSIWESRPAWASEVPLGHRVYAWHVLSKIHAQMLHDIGVRWIYIGADGKEGFTNEWSKHHPLVRTLENCRQFDLKVSVGFVLGQRNQTWGDIERWHEFSRRMVEEFADVLIISDGWVNVIAPGSPDWSLLCQQDPSFGLTDCPDLEHARAVFWERCTELCDGRGPDEVRRLLYEWAPRFENDLSRHPGTPRSFMLRP